MKMKILVIGGLVTAAILAGGWALAQSRPTVRAASDRLSCMAWARMAWAQGNDAGQNGEMGPGMTGRGSRQMGMGPA